MYQAIFTRISQATKKNPRRIKVYSNGMAEYYIYQDKLSTYDNHAMACQHFCNIKGIDGDWYAALDQDGIVFVQTNSFCMVNKKTNFDEEIKNDRILG